jgi:hypothetical protein
LRQSVLGSICVPEVLIFVAVLTLGIVVLFARLGLDEGQVVFKYQTKSFLA